MTVLMTSNLPGVDQEGYDRLAAALIPVMKGMDGFIAHAAGPVSGGYQVSELWESEQAHSAWFQAHVLPSMPPGATPDITFRPITKTATRD